MIMLLISAFTIPDLIKKLRERIPNEVNP